MSEAAEVFHPGEFVKEEMETRGWSIQTLATASDLKIQTLQEVIRSVRRSTHRGPFQTGAARGV